MDKASCLSLYFLKLDNAFWTGRVPCWGCIFQYRSHQRGVGCAPDFHGTLSKVSLQKSQGSRCLNRKRIYMSVPTEVVADGKAKIFSTVNVQLQGCDNGAWIRCVSRVVCWCWCEWPDIFLGGTTFATFFPIPPKQEILVGLILHQHHSWWACTAGSCPQRGEDRRPWQIQGGRL